MAKTISCSGQFLTRQNANQVCVIKNEQSSERPTTVFTLSAKGNFKVFLPAPRRLFIYAKQQSMKNMPKLHKQKSPCEERQNRPIAPLPEQCKTKKPALGSAGHQAKKFLILQFVCVQ
jgi:hypothetical protein